MHKPVLLNEVLDLLGVKTGGTYIDGTLGSGGHSEGIFERAGSQGRLLAIDRDVEALERSRKRLERFGEQCIFAHGNFAEMDSIAGEQGIDSVDGILLDLGNSSEQLDMGERGFSFSADGPLDMRMDQSRGVTAEDLVNEMSEADLVSIFKKYAQEPSAKRVAGMIVRERAKERIVRTAQLADLVSRVKGGRRGRIDPATKVFQALRMAVNKELESIIAGLDAALKILKPGGRLAVISFHSGEDRLVKHFIARHEGRYESLMAGGDRWIGEEPRVKRITRKPVTPSERECGENRRARSAKLRVAEMEGESGETKSKVA